MSEGQATGTVEGQTTEAKVDDAAAVTADTAPETKADTKEVDASGADKPAEAAKTEDKTAAPEKYDFKSPEGFEVNQDVVTAYAGVAKELGLSQESAQTILEKMTPVISGQNAALLEGAVAEWKTAQKTDKEYGGDKLEENLSVAKKALDAFGTPELIELLDQSKLRDHPEVIRAFYRVGKQLSEDSIVRGTVRAAEQSDLGASMYPKTREQLAKGAIK